MNFMSFEQWKKENQDLCDAIVEEPCQKCHGLGYCLSCDAPCEDCDGFGEDEDAALRQIYNEKKDEQLKKLKEWQDMMKTLKVSA